MSPTETIEEAYARLNQDLADALEKIKRLTTEVEQLKHMQPTVDPSLIANAAKMTELSEKALAADIEYRKTVLSKPNYNDRRWGAALAIYCEQECEVDEAWTRAEEFMDAEPADSYRTREPAPISEERHNREFPMQPVVMVGNVIRFKANPLVRILLDAYPNGLNGLCGKDPDRDEAAWSQLAQLIGYSVSGYRDLSYAEDRVSEAAGVESAIILKQFREPEPAPPEEKCSSPEELLRKAATAVESGGSALLTWKAESTSPAEPKPEPEWLTELVNAVSEFISNAAFEAGVSFPLTERRIRDAFAAAREADK